MGKKMAPATKKPHAAWPKHQKMCVSQAMKHKIPMIPPMSFPLEVWQIVIHIVKATALWGLLALLAWLFVTFAGFVDVRPPVPTAFL